MLCTITNVYQIIPIDNSSEKCRVEDRLPNVEDQDDLKEVGTLYVWPVSLVPAVRLVRA